MKRPAWVLTFNASVLLFGVAAIAATPVDKPPVLSQTLTKLEVPGKISAALWTRRADYFTLQLVRRTAARPGTLPTAGRTVQSASVPPATENVQVWLLKADGTNIPPIRRSETPGAQKSACGMRCLGYDIQYEFSLAEGAEAVAVAMNFGDDFFIQKLSSLPQ